MMALYQPGKRPPCLLSYKDLAVSHDNYSDHIYRNVHDAYMFFIFIVFYVYDALYVRVCAHIIMITIA